MDQNLLLIAMLVLAVGVMWYSGRSRKQQMAKMEEEKREQLRTVTPGAWVHTRVGFWGRFVDLDGDIVVLETTDGHEMYWDRQMIGEIGGEPPLEGAAQEVAEDDEAPEEDEAVLGLEPAADQPDGSEDADAATGAADEADDKN
ncbi:preprotein translocase subunit YajC [Schaalia georgiae]|nr:preprotein translocase subunit YajC [Schaalia georgiae]